MPYWTQIVVGIAALAAALGYLWQKVIRPGAKVISRGEELRPLVAELTTLVPLMQSMVTEFGSTRDVFAILDEIVAQVRNDSGSSIKDVLDRLDRASKANAIAAEVLATNLEAVKLLAAADRAAMARLTEAILRIETHSVVSAGHDAQVADDLTRASEAVVGVATDLARAHERADAIDSGGAPGSAADAASRMTDAEARLIEEDDQP